jgi:hypothetical protein
MDANQAEMKGTQEQMKRQIGSLLSDRDEFKQEIKANREQMLAELKADREADLELKERMDANTKSTEET